METPRSHSQRQLHDVSGRFHTDDPTTLFLYLLMRDQVPTGVVGDILDAVEARTDDTTAITNGWLARYAEHVSDRLRIPEMSEATGARKSRVNPVPRWLSRMLGDALERGIVSQAQADLVELCWTTPNPALDHLNGGTGA